MPSLNYAALNGLMGESYDAQHDPYHEQNYNPGFLDRYRQGRLHYNHLQDNVMAEEHDLNTMLPHSDSSAMPDDSPTLRHLQYRNQNQQYRHQADGRYDVVPHFNQAAAYEEREAYPYEPEPIQDYPSEEYEQVNRNGMDVERNDVQDPRTMPIHNRYGFDGGHNGPSTSHDYTLPPNNNGMSQMTAHGIDLVPTTRLPDSFRRIFRFRQFNAVQSKVFPSVYGTDDNLVVSSPTGSGKTAIFELALLRMIKSWSIQDEVDRKVAVYLAPTKALCTERYQDWKEKFHPLGLKCLEYTGDTDGTKSFAVESRNVDIIITTPEKWDAVTRVTRHSDQIMQRLGLLMIDEVHLLHESRGAVLEVVVSRMRTTARASPVRVVALSATVPNVEDVARWLRPLTPSGTDIYEAGGSGGAADQRAAYLDMKMAKVYKFGEAFRPTRLERFVVGYNSAGMSPRVLSLALLVDISAALSPIEVANSKDATLAGAGIAFHHGGLEQLARKRIEDGFRSGQLMIIVSTSTLAVGVNLPAHTVVVVGTKCWINGGMEEYSDLDMQQMIGRAGRPQYDTHGQVVIMCEKQHKQKWKDSVESKTILESRLHETLTEHINSEISLRTIRSLSDGHQWIQSSFLYVRIQQNPKHYAAALATKGEHSMNWQQALDDFVNSAVEQLSKDGLVETDDGADVVEDYNLRSVASTKLGDVMSACVLRLPTMQKILAMPKNATFEELLSLFCSSAEFSEIAFRQAEKTLLRKINKGDEFRFPAPTNQAFEHHHWVSMLMQTCLGAICLEDYLDQSKGQKINLTKELYQIWRCAPRICRAIAFVAGTKEYGGAMLSALELMRTINGKAWEDSTVVLRQIDTIGPKSIKVLASQNIKGFADLRRQSASRLELLLNRHPGFGNKLLEAAQDFPTFRLQIQQETDASEETVGPIKIEFSVVIEVEGRLIKKGAKKGGKSGHRNLSIVAIRSDGEYVTEFHTSTKNFESVNRSLRIPAAFTEEGQKLLVMVGIDQLAGCSSVQEFSPEIPEGVLPKPVVNEADLLQTSLPKSAAKPTKKAVDPVAMQNMNEEQVFDAFYEDSQGEEPSGDSERLPNGNYKCKHKCKAACQHVCCKEGVKPKSRARANRAPAAPTPVAEAAKPKALPRKVDGTGDMIIEKPVRAPTDYTDEGIDEMMMYLLEAENEAESRKRPAKRNLNESQADQAEGSAKRQKRDDEPVPEYLLQSERIRGWTPDESSSPRSKADPVEYAELEAVSRQMYSPSPDAMDMAAQPGKEDQEPLFFSRPSSVADVVPPDPMVFDPPDDPPSSMSFDVKEGLPIVASKPRVQPSDADAYSYFLDLDDLIAPEPDPKEVRKPALTSHDEVAEETKGLFEPIQEASNKPAVKEHLDTSFAGFSILTHADQWEDKPAFIDPVETPLYQAPTEVNRSSIGHAPEAIEPFHKAEEPLPIKAENDMVGSDMADFDSWFADGNIEIVD